MFHHIEQINWLVSIWWEHWPLRGLNIANIFIMETTADNEFLRKTIIQIINIVDLQQKMKHFGTLHHKIPSK